MTASLGNDALRARLQSGAEVLAPGLGAAQIDRLMDFLALLQKWNRVYNLTALRDPQEMLTQHLLDSLAALAPLRRHLTGLTAVTGLGQGAGPLRLLDVGSGAGLPGVVFAICCPQLDVHCVDSVGKKAAFIGQVALQLRLRNLHGVHARVETLTAPFGIICCRAFAALPDFVRWTRAALRAPDGVWLALKGKHPGAEIAALPDDVQVFHVEQLTVPGLAAERCIVWLRPTAASAAAALA